MLSALRRGLRGSKFIKKQLNLYSQGVRAIMDRKELKQNYEALKLAVDLIEGLTLAERAASGLYSIWGWETVKAALAVARAAAERVDPVAEFSTRLNTYVLNGYGELCQKQYYHGPHNFSGSWLLAGGRPTWNAQFFKFTTAELIADPEKLKGLWICDVDHGTFRSWRGDGPVKSVRVLRGPVDLSGVAAKLAAYEAKKAVHHG